MSAKPPRRTKSPVTQQDGAGHPRTPFDRVHRGIIRALYEGRFVPGQRLAAPDLMREFDVGRGTIREVLQRLDSTGIVRIIPQKGARVRRLTRSEVAEVLELVEVLIGLAARGASRSVADPNLKQEFLARSEALANTRSDRNFDGFVEAREDYYGYLLKLAANRELRRVFPAIQVHIVRMQLRMFDHAGDAADLGDYRLLDEAILGGDPDRAEAAGRLHVRRTIGRVADLPDRAFEADG